MTDLIRRADAIDATWKEPAYTDAINVLTEVRERIKALPSAEAESNDLIIKGAKGIKDGLYNIKDGKLFQYKAKGGTVRTYQIIKGGDTE